MRFEITKTTGSKNNPQPDTIRIKGKIVKFSFNMVGGVVDGSYLFYIPSLNISAYGKDESEAQEMLQESTDVFTQDLISLPSKERDKYLVSIGFNKEAFKNKNFSKAYIDDQGLLQNFEPGTIKRNILETV